MTSTTHPGGADRVKPTAEQYKKWSATLFVLLGEVEEAHGENPAGTYPSPLEMALWFAQREASRAMRNATEVPL